MAGLFGFFRKKDKQKLPVTQEDQIPDTDQETAPADETSAPLDQNAADTPAAEPAQKPAGLRDYLPAPDSETTLEDKPQSSPKQLKPQPTHRAALTQSVTKATLAKRSIITSPDMAQGAEQQSEKNPPVQIHTQTLDKTAVPQSGAQSAEDKLSVSNTRPDKAESIERQPQPTDLQEIAEDASTLKQPANPPAPPEQTLAEQAQEENIISAAEDDLSSDSELPGSGSEPRASFFDRLRRTRENLAVGLSSFMKGRNIDLELYDELETSLLTADLGVDTTALVIDRLRREARLRELHDASLLKNRLIEILCDILHPCEVPLEIGNAQAPYVILMIGVNGSGKTTTIGKLAHIYQQQGRKVMLAAGDTFRAAAVEQLKTWGERTGIPVIAQQTGSDSASVIFDALSAAHTRAMDLLICDTAGRLQNKEHLMKELEKIVRVMKKHNPEVPHETMLVLDGTTGQNAVSQTKLFNTAVPVTGLCLTKLDGTAKGGVVFALADKFKIPIRYIGIGEKANDLREFKAREFVKALIDES